MMKYVSRLRFEKTRGSPIFGTFFLVRLNLTMNDSINNREFFSKIPIGEQ